jgi:tripartite-type tricarboxylate transporter receptor subunit TctC
MLNSLGGQMMRLPHRRQFLHLTACAIAFPAVSRTARAQTYPARPVRVIVPYAPGGQTDVIARLLAQRLSEHFGKQYYVENMPGAGGNIGMGRAAQAAPDGYTILVADGTAYVVNPSLYNKVPYDPNRDFDPVSLGATTTQILAVNPSVPARTVKDLIAVVKANPGKYSYASPGMGTPGHLTGELFRGSLGLDIVHVPYNGGGPAIASTVAGHTPIAFGSPAASIPQIKDGNLRALGVAAKTRLPALPNVLTMTEAGFPDIECNAWIGVLVPVGTPANIIALLNHEIATIVALPDMKDRLVTLGFESAADTPEEFAGRIKVDVAKWAKVVKLAGIKVE